MPFEDTQDRRDVDARARRSRNKGRAEDARFSVRPRESLPYPQRDSELEVHDISSDLIPGEPGYEAP